MDTLINSFQSFIDRGIEKIPEILLSLLVILITHFVGMGIRKIYSNILGKSDISATHISFFGKIIYGFVMTLGILICLNILGYYGIVTSILASGGITAVILGFAFKDIGENFLAGFIMAFSRPFSSGDLIESEGLLGRVKKIELRHTHIRTGDGCDVFIPSTQLVSKPLFNYTRDGLRRGSFVVGIDYGDDAERACELLLNRIAEDKMVISEPEPSVQISGFNPLFVEITVYFWIETDTNKQEIYLAKVRSRLMEKCRIALSKQGFTFSSGVKSAVELNDLNVNLQADTNLQSGGSA